MDAWQAINTIRVVRKFSDEPISPHNLDRILNAGRRTASSKNQQHWLPLRILVGVREGRRDRVHHGRELGPT
jgi:nitroreductase